MLIDLTDILKSEDKVVQTEVPFEPEAFVSEAGRFPIVSKTPVALVIQNKGNQDLLITGKVTLAIDIPCGRCLKDVRTDFKLSFERELDMKLDASKWIEDLDEHNYINGYNLDVDRLVDGELILSWPMKVLCSEACKGICSNCGTDLNRKTCDCDTADLDPRMAKIRDIFSKFKEV